MESRNYWHCFDGRFMAWEEKLRAAGKWRTAGSGWSGEESGLKAESARGVSLEVYLSVPTFVRRGIRLNIS